MDDLLQMMSLTYWISFAVWGVLWGITCGVIASTKNRDPVGWFVLGVLFSIFAVVWILVLKPLSPRRVEEAVDLPDDEPPRPGRAAAVIAAIAVFTLAIVVVLYQSCAGR